MVRLFQYFERIADAPIAVPRLRHFILELAVRGKLLSVKMNVEPTSTYNQQEPTILNTPFTIPYTWTWARLQTLGRISGGGTPSKTRDDYWNGPIPWISPKDMKVDYLQSAQMGITEAALVGSAAHLIDASSILFVVRGMILAHSFPVALTCVSAAINQDMKALTLTNPEMGAYILLALKGLKQQMLAKVLRSTHGTCRLDGPDYSDFLIPIPPLAEQHSIVAKVNEMMALCDELEAARARRESARDRFAAASYARLNAPDPDAVVSANDARFALQSFNVLTTRPDQIKQLRQTILNLAVGGKLVPQDPDDEPASYLLNRLTVEKSRLISAGFIRNMYVPDIDSTDAPRLLPRTWAWTRLGTIGDWGSGSTPSRSGAGLYGGTITWLKSGELNDNRGLTGSEEKITDRALESGSFRRNRAGDVLIAMYGATIGKVAILAEDAVTNQAVCGCTAFSGISNQFLFFFLLSQREMFQAASEGGAQPNISKVKIIWTPFPLPPLAEQQRIVAKVDELMTLCDQLEASLAAGEHIRRRLLGALIADALKPTVRAAKEPMLDRDSALVPS